jgi:hypothetical protein
VMRKSPRFIYVRGALWSFHTAWVLVVQKRLRPREIGDPRLNLARSRNCELESTPVVRRNEQCFCAAKAMSRRIAVRLPLKIAGESYGRTIRRENALFEAPVNRLLTTFDGSS